MVYLQTSPTGQMRKYYDIEDRRSFMLSSTQLRQANAVILSRALFRFYRLSVTNIGLKDSSKTVVCIQQEGDKGKYIFQK